MPGLGGAHETLAHIYGAVLALAMAGYFRAACGLPRRFRVRRAGGLFLIVIPLAGFAVSRPSLLFGDDVAMPGAYAQLRLSVWNSLALWEWIAGVGTYLFLGLLLTLPENGER